VSRARDLRECRADAAPDRFNDLQRLLDELLTLGPLSTTMPRPTSPPTRIRTAALPRHTRRVAMGEWVRVETAGERVHAAGKVIDAGDA
jgi:hypothetical protein